MEPNQALIASQVCRGWRDLISKDSVFWSNLVLNVSGKRHQLLFEHSIRLFTKLGKFHLTSSLGQLCHHVSEELAFRGAEKTKKRGRGPFFSLLSIERLVYQAGKQNSLELYNYLGNDSRSILGHQTLSLTSLEIYEIGFITTNGRIDDRYNSFFHPRRNIMNLALQQPDYMSKLAMGFGLAGLNMD